MGRSLFLVAIFASACGGGGPSTGGPLRFTLDETHIAQVPIEEKQSVLNAKTDFEKAKMEESSWVAQLDDVKTKLDIARNEAQQAKLTVESARREKDAANKSADRTRINNADRDARSAELGKQSAEMKVAFLEAKKRWLERATQFGKANTYAKEARLELEKAKVASARNIRPSGFQLSDYDKQNRERGDVAGRFKKDSDGKKAEAEQKRQAWNSKEKEYMSAKGITPPPEGGAPTVGAGTQTQTPKPSTTSTDNNAVLK